MFRVGLTNYLCTGTHVLYAGTNDLCTGTHVLYTGTHDLCAGTAVYVNRTDVYPPGKINLYTGRMFCTKGEPFYEQGE